MSTNGKKLIFTKSPFEEAKPEGRIVDSYKKIKEFVEHCKGLGIKIVLTQGSWDMVHVGHARYLEAAKHHGDLLIVGVDSDKKIRHRKGPDRPVVPQDERLEMLTHLRPVDVVVLKHLNDPKWALIKTVRPDVLIAIADTYNGKQIKELKKFCGKVTILPRQATTSTSAKIRLLQINVAKKFGQALTPKVITAIDEVFGELKVK